MSKVFYIGNFSFPYGNASGARVIGNGYLLRELGHEVSFIGLDKNLTKNDSLESSARVYDSFTYYNIAPSRGVSDWLNYSALFNDLTVFLEKQKPDIIILYGSLTLSLINDKIRRWCIKHKVRFFVDCVDMIPVRSGSLLFRLIKSFDEYYQKRVVNFRSEGVIAISNYISDFYNKKVDNTIVLPPIVSPDRFINGSRPDFDKSHVNLVYVGNPFPTDGRKIDRGAFKDRLDLVVEILAEMNDPKVIFRIYGLTKEDYLRALPEHNGLLDKLGTKIIFAGYVDNPTAVSAIKASDFTVLLRDVNKMTTAGFPTKFVESIACGTPVITNNTSDLSFYLVDGKNGFMLKSLEKAYLAERFASIFDLDRSIIDEKRSYTMNNNPFLFQNYKDQFKRFLEHE